MKLNNKNLLVLLLVLLIIILFCLCVYFNSNKQIELFNNTTNSRLLKSLEVYQFPVEKKIRVGCANDGGYIIGDMGNIYDCYISAGISREESFSRDFINEYNMNEYNSFGFDESINNYPDHYTKKISFIKKKPT